VAKTYALQAADQPLAQGFLRSTTPGGRVDLEEKLRIDNTVILLEKLYFLKGQKRGCG
jgi:hypothetical protein